jgi:PAS domain S-box-containing protein
MSLRFRVLQVEDSVQDAFLNVRALQRNGLEVESERVETAAQMKTALARSPWDLILCDHRLPQFDSLAALALYKESGLDIPFIVVSGKIGEEQAVKLIKAGAHEFVMKDSLEQLASAVRRELRAAEERRIRKRSHDTEMFMASIVKDCDNAIFGETLEGSIVSWNRGAEKLYGYTASEILGGPVSILEPSYRPADQPAILAKVRRGESVAHFETVHLRKDRTAIEVSLTVSPVKDPSGRVVGASTVSTDTTMRKYEERERLALIQDLTAALARTGEEAATTKLVSKPITAKELIPRQQQAE